MGLSLLFSAQSIAQVKLTKYEKLASLCEVWGFLKYYQPIVASGTIDFDKALVNKIQPVLLAANKYELSQLYLRWINELGTVKLPRKYKYNNSLGEFTRNFNTQWINDTTLFTDSLISKLQYIMKNRNQKKNYYVQQANFGWGQAFFKNEKSYKEMIFPITDYRLLGLFRFWNVINYFYPYKYLIGEDWNKVLIEMIPIFENAKDTIAYNMAILELSATLNDSHSGGFLTPYIIKYFGNYWVPFLTDIIGNRAVVIKLLNDSLCKIDGIQIGDVIIDIGDESVDALLDSTSKYIAASNRAVRLRDVAYLSFPLFNGKTDRVKIRYERHRIIENKIIHRYYFNAYADWAHSFDKYKIPLKDNKVSMLISNDIGYINLGILNSKDVNHIMNKFWNTKALILDLRNNGNLKAIYKICDRLCKSKEEFDHFLIPDLSYPGMFKWGSASFCGKRNENYYKGKVILLIDERTQSLGETACMALNTAPNVVMIGSHTAGTNGNITDITLPGGYLIKFSGMGVYTADGKTTQRTGIIPDIKISPTIEDLKENKDVVLEKAIEYAKDYYH